MDEAYLQRLYEVVKGVGEELQVKRSVVGHNYKYTLPSSMRAGRMKGSYKYLKIICPYCTFKAEHVGSIPPKEDEILMYCSVFEHLREEHPMRFMVMSHGL